MYRDSKEKRCEICGEKFVPKVPQQKRCGKKECTKEAKRLNALLYRKRMDSRFKDITIEDLKKPKHKTQYENILKVFNSIPDEQGDNDFIGLSWSELYRKSGMKDRTTFDHYIKTFCKLGILTMKEGKYYPSERSKYEVLALRQRDIILNTSMKNAFFRPSPGWSGWCKIYYFPNLPGGIKSIEDVDNVSEKLNEVEKYLAKAEHIFLGILSDARKQYMKNLWSEKILDNNDIYILTKFYFSLEMIFDLNVTSLEVAAYFDGIDTTLNNIYKKFKRIWLEAFVVHLLKKYPSLTRENVGNLMKNMNEQYDLHNEYFREISREIRYFRNPSVLNHLLTVDFSVGKSNKEVEEVIEAYGKKIPVAKPVDIERDKPIKSYMSKLLESNLSTQSDNLKKVGRERETKPYSKPPFFEKYFEGFEESLMGLGFEEADGNRSLKRYFERLDRDAEEILIPVLPDNPDLLWAV